MHALHKHISDKYIQGKISGIFHNQETILKDVPNPLQVIKCHSLAANSDILPQDPKINTTADEGTIMGVRHKEYPIESLQFDPEFIKMKPYGREILKNF